MCGIIGFMNQDDSVSKVLAGLDIIKNRGLDGFGISAGNKLFFGKDLSQLRKSAGKTRAKTALGHCLHSLVGFVPQPIQQKGVLAANCEIYNWRELCKKYSISARNDSELIINIIEKKGVSHIKEIIKEFDGVYAFAYLHKDELYLCRDIIGIKPLWFSRANGFAFASEKKALLGVGIHDDQIEELNPRTILKYSISKNNVSETKRRFFSVEPTNKRPEEEIIKELSGLVISAISKRVPEQKFGILFSGGIDSTLIAMICKKLGLPFVCYTAALVHPGMEEAEDVVYAKRVAKRLGFSLKIKEIKLEDVEKRLGKIIALIEDTNVVKAGVALTFHVACEAAKKDGVRVLFSGLGSEELFAGYERHRHSKYVNKECLSGLLKMYERDTYRDDVITMNSNIELRLPLLDKDLIDYSLKIPEKYKLNNDQNKIIIRKVAQALGIPEEFSQRKKKAAQYGSNFDKAIKKLSSKAGFRLKSDYLSSFVQCKNPRIGVLFSSGKDSAYALYIMKQQNYPVECLITIKSRNPDSYMFHTPNIHLARLQSRSMGIPIVEQESDGEKEKELADLEKALISAKKKYRIEGVATGALYSSYQRDRIEKVCDNTGLKIFNPLWHFGQENEMRQLLKDGFRFLISSIAAEGLDRSWLGRIITEKDVDKLALLNKKMGFNIAGEGGEFESLVVDCPLFQKRIEIKEYEIVEESKNTARFIVKKAVLADK